MIHHSYKVLLKKAESKHLGLLISLKKKPENERANHLLKSVDKEIEWLKMKINKGEDTGVYTL